MEEKKIDIEFRSDNVHETYSNLAIITHSESEFILDFAQMMPGLPKPTVKGRIILAPEHAKRLLNALTDNINKYEAQFGAIRSHERTIMPFGGNNGETKLS